MKIGFIGLGIMGESMCENIVKKHDDTVYCFDFIPAKVELLASKGAVPCKDSVELAEKSDVIISMVPKSEHSMSVYKTILPVLGAGKTCIDMSTIDPSVSVEISKMVKATGAAFMDAPVVKSKPAAIAGKLGIYMGGDEATCEAMRPILAYMGENIIRMGDNGKGLVMKICHNALVTQIQNGVNETLSLAQLNGISVEDYATAISYGGGQNFYLDGQWRPAATGIGKRPTVDSSENAAVTCETFVPDFSGNVYGQQPVLEFHKYFCPVRKFNSMDELAALIHHAADESKAYFAALNGAK